MFFEGLVPIIAVVITAMVLGLWLVLIIGWKKKVLRYILLPLAVLGTWWAFLFWGHSPDKDKAALAWAGRYALTSCHAARPAEADQQGPILVVQPDQACRIEGGGTATLAGEWHYVTSDDRPYLELTFPGRASIKLFGRPRDIRVIGTFPIAGCR